MRVSVHPTGQGMTDVHLQGELDHEAATTVHEVLDGITRRPGGLMLDLSGLTHIDADGVRLVVEFACRYRAAGRAVTVTGSSREVEREFEHSAGVALLPIRYV